MQWKKQCPMLGINNFEPIEINFEKYHYFCIMERVRVSASIKQYL